MDKEKHQKPSLWSSLKKKHFVTLLQLHKNAQNQAHNAKRKKWSTEAWEKIPAGMHTRYPSLNFSMKQLNKLEKHLRKSYKLIKEIEELPGFGFDKDKHKIVASDDNWTNLLKNNRKARKFRTRPLPYYAGLEDLYGEGSPEINSIEPAIEQVGKNEESSKLEQSSTQNVKIENSTLNEPITTTQQAGTNETSTRATVPITTTQQEGKTEEDFSIERCIAEYYELPAEVREQMDFKQICKIFENEPLRYYFLAIPKDNIEFRKGLLNANITNCTIKKDGESKEDFSIERCIAEYYELPAKMRENFDFKQILEIFENKHMRYFFMSIPKSNIEFRQGLLSANITKHMRKKDGQNKEASKQDEATTSSQNDKNQESSYRQAELTATQDGKNEEDFSIERCIAEYYELPVEVRKIFNFKQIVIFQRERMRKYFISIAKSNIALRQNFLKLGVSIGDYTKTKGLHKEKNKAPQPNLRSYQPPHRFQQPYQPLQQFHQPYQPIGQTQIYQRHMQNQQPLYQQAGMYSLHLRRDMQYQGMSMWGTTSNPTIPIITLTVAQPGVSATSVPVPTVPATSVAVPTVQAVPATSVAVPKVPVAPAVIPVTSLATVPSVQAVPAPVQAVPVSVPAVPGMVPATSVPAIPEMVPTTSVAGPSVPAALATTSTQAAGSSSTSSTYAHTGGE